MKLRLLRSLLIVTSATAVVFLQAQEPSCSAASRECEQQIRHMLSGKRYLGLEVVDLKPGLIVKAVLPNSPAVRADLRPGDRLIAVNGKPLAQATASDFKQVLADARQTGRLWIIVQRRGAYRKIDARLEPFPKEHVDKVIAGHMSQSHTATAGAQP